jgi:hypothetical protein
MAGRRIVTAASELGDIDMEKVWDAVRGSPADLRAKGLTVAVHNDYRLSGKAMTFWLMTWDTGQSDTFGEPISRSFKGEGETDAEALDKIRAKFAAVTDNHHHAPMCPANHYHGMRAPTGGCTCGAVRMGVFMRSGRENRHGASPSSDSAPSEIEGGRS